MIVFVPIEVEVREQEPNPLDRFAVQDAPLPSMMLTMQVGVP